MISLPGYNRQAHAQSKLMTGSPFFFVQDNVYAFRRGSMDQTYFTNP